MPCVRLEDKLSRLKALARGGERQVEGESVRDTLLELDHEKEGYDAEGLQRVWGHVENLSDSIAKGRVNARDLLEVLRDEAGIVLE